MSGAKSEKQIDGLKQRIIAKVREFSLLGLDTSGNSQLKPKTELKVLIGGNGMQTSVAIDQLIRDGALIEKVEEALSPHTRKLVVRKVIALPEAAAVRVVEAPLDLSSALLGIVAGIKA